MDLGWSQHDLALDPAIAMSHGLPEVLVRRCPVLGDKSIAGSRLATGWIGTGRCDGVGLRMPLVEMPKYPFDHN